MLSVSILGMDDELYRIGELNSLDIDFVHLDIMDGMFVSDSNIVDEGVVSKINKPLDVHLMVQDPANYIVFYAKYKPKYITVHAELPNVLYYLNAIRNKKIGVGIAINPSTSLDVLEELLPYVDLILIMSVEPGKGGQKFMNSTINRIRKVKDMCKSINPNIQISVDGGVKPDNIKNCKEVGADILVVGSYITTSSTYQEPVLELKNAINK